MSNRVIHEGILEKFGGKAGFRKKWQQRHCILRPHRLQYGIMDSNNQFREKKHVLKINAVSVRVKEDDDTQLIFELVVRKEVANSSGGSASTDSAVVKERAFQFKADSTRARDVWITQLTKWIGPTNNRQNRGVSITSGRRRSHAVNMSSSPSPHHQQSHSMTFVEPVSVAMSETMSDTSSTASTSSNTSSTLLGNIGSFTGKIRDKVQSSIELNRENSKENITSIKSILGNVSSQQEEFILPPDRKKKQDQEEKSEEFLTSIDRTETANEQSIIETGIESDEDMKSREDGDFRRFEKIAAFFPAGGHYENAEEVSNAANTTFIDGTRLDLTQKIPELEPFMELALKDAQARITRVNQSNSGNNQNIDRSKLEIFDDAKVEPLTKQWLRNERIYWSRYCGREDSTKKSVTELVILVLTDKHVILVNPDTYEFIRKLELCNIKHILQSGYDQSIVSIVTTETMDYDILLHFKVEKAKKSSVDSHLTEAQTYDKKIQFFDYITVLYRSFILSKGSTVDLKIHFVNDVHALSRRSESEKKTPKDVPRALRLNPSEILQINYTNDKVRIYTAPSLCRVISSFGDKEILFAGNVDKLTKSRKHKTRLLVITDAAVYTFTNIHAKMFTRRIELEEVGELVRAFNNKDQLVIRVPDEYDLFIQSKHHIETICSVFKELFSDPEDELIRVCGASEDILRFSVLKKTKAYKKKSDMFEDYNSVINLLRNAITQHAPHKMKLYLEYANMIEANNKTIPNEVQLGIKATARNELLKIKEQEIIKDEYTRALMEEDIVKIDECTRRIAQLKIVYEPLKLYLKRVQKKRMRIMNKAALLYRIKHAIQNYAGHIGSGAIEEAMDAALRAGFADEVKEYKHLFELEIQKSCLEKKLEESQKNHNVDNLLTIIESAKHTGIYSDNSGIKTKFEEAELNMQEYIQKKRVCNNIMEAIEDAKETNKTSTLDALCKRSLESHKWIETTSAYTLAMKTIEDIKGFRVEILKLDKSLDLLDIKLQDKTSNLTDKKITLTVTKYLDRIHVLMNDKHIKLGKKDEKIIQRANETLAKLNQIVRAIKSEEAVKILATLRKAIERNDPEDTIMKTVAHAKDFMEYNSELENLVVNTESRIQTQREISTLDQNEYNYSHMDHVSSLISNAERFNLMTSDLEVRLQEVYDYVSKEYDIYENLRSALDSHDTHLVKSCLTEATEFESMAEIVKEAKQFLNKKRMEELTIRKNLEKAIRTEDFAKMSELIQQARVYSSLDPLVQRAKNKLSGDDVPDSKFEEDIDRFISDGDAEGLSQYIAENEDVLPSHLLKVAKAQVNKLRGDSLTIEDIKQAMINATSKKDLKELKIAIENAEQMLKGAEERQIKPLQALLKRAHEIETKLQNAENIGLVKSVHQQLLGENARIPLGDNDPRTFTTMLKQGLLYRGVGEYKRDGPTTELLERLQTHVTKLRSVCAEQDRFDDKLGKYLIEMNNKLGQNVVVILSDVLAHKTKKRLFSSAKTSYEILKGLKRPEVARLVDKFESLDIVKDQLQERQYGILSVLFVHFMLSENQFMNVLSYLLTDEPYMKECYDTTALLRGVAYRDEIYPYLSILNMFHFEFRLNSQSDTLIASPISRLKSVIRHIVQYFVANKSEAQDKLILVGTESLNESLGPLIRTDLCNALLSIITHKFKTSGFFVKYDLWQMIEEAAESRKVSAIDIGGLFLPTAVRYINDHMFISNDQKRNESELKFKALICYCLNEKTLADVFETIFKDHDLLIKYYDVDDYHQKPLIMDMAIFNKMCVYLRTLTQLPFDLYISGDGEKILQNRSYL